MDNGLNYENKKVQLLPFLNIWNMIEKKRKEIIANKFEKNKGDGKKQKLTRIQLPRRNPYITISANWKKILRKKCNWLRMHQCGKGVGFAW